MRRAAAVLAVLAAATASGSAPAVAARPPIRHVFVVVLENHDYGTTFGRSTRAPYLARTLARRGQLLTGYHAIGHHSLGNYLALVAGVRPTAQANADCHVFTEVRGGDGCVYPRQVRTVGGQLTARGLSWRAYLEDMRTPCRHPALGTRDPTQRARPGDSYAVRHNPFVYFHSVIDTPACARRDVPLQALPGDLSHPRRTPNLSLIVPNLCNDAHDDPCADGRPGGLARADAWLRAWIPRILGAPAFRRDGLLVVTFDEAARDASGCCGSSPGGGRVGAVAISRSVRPGSVNDTPYDHYALLRTIEDLFGLPYLGEAGRPGLRPFGADVFAGG